MLIDQDSGIVPKIDEVVAQDTTMPIDVAIKVAGALPRYYCGKMGWL